MQKKGGKKGRKLGRNAKWCQAYEQRGQREKNKARKLRRHIRHKPNDHVAKDALAELTHYRYKP